MFLSLPFAILHGVNPEYHNLSIPCREGPKSLTSRYAKIKVARKRARKKGKVKEQREECI